MQHVLIVEDEPLIAEVVVTALEDDYRTSIAPTSAAALRLLTQHSVDLMLLDCTLPDGLDPGLIPTADRMGVPVVLMSGDKQRIQGLTPTPRPSLLKPFRLTDLVAAVRREIASRPRYTSPAEQTGADHLAGRSTRDAE